jgi:hypothetical protein
MNTKAKAKAKAQAKTAGAAATRPTMSTFAVMRARLLNLPRSWWLALIIGSLMLHAVAVAIIIVLLFGGETGGGAARPDMVISAGAEDALDIEIDAELPQEAEYIEAPPAEMDLSELLDVPLEADFRNAMRDMATSSAIAPAMPMPSQSVAQRSLPGGGVISGVPQNFADYIAHLQNTGIDVVFAIDATGSMVWVHKKVHERMQTLARYIRSLVPLARFGIIAYRDYSDREFVIRSSQPSFDIRKAVNFIGKIDALGGGDIPEAVTEALRQAEKKTAWRAGAQRVVIVIGDAPPHPHEMTEAAQIAERMKSRGARLSLLDSSAASNRKLLGRSYQRFDEDLRTTGVMPQFRRLAQLGGGTAATLSAERQLMKTMALLIFDDRFHDELAPFLANLE